MLTTGPWLRAKTTVLAGCGHRSLKRPPDVPSLCFTLSNSDSTHPEGQELTVVTPMVSTQGPRGSFVEKCRCDFLPTTTLLLKHRNCSFPLSRARWHSNWTWLKTHSPHGHCMVQLTFGILIPKVLIEWCWTSRLTKTKPLWTQI